MAQSIVSYTTGPRVLRAINNDTGTPVQLSTTGYGNAPFRKAWIYGLKANQTNNTGIVYLGIEATNGQQFIPIAAGAVLELEAPVAQQYDWGMFWLDVATAGDGIIALYS